MHSSSQLILRGCSQIFWRLIDDVDCTKVDGKNLVGVIVSIGKNKSTCKVAVKQGLLHQAYVYHSLRVVPEASNNREVMDLEDAFKDWKGLPKITEREAAHFVSSVGGQGMTKCNCKGDCSTNSCACKKAGRICSLCCHRNSKCCKNNKDWMWMWLSYLLSSKVIT